MFCCQILVPLLYKFLFVSRNFIKLCLSGFSGNSPLPPRGVSSLAHPLAIDTTPTPPPHPPGSRYSEYSTVNILQHQDSRGDSNHNNHQDTESSSLDETLSLDSRYSSSVTSRISPPRPPPSSTKKKPAPPPPISLPPTPPKKAPLKLPVENQKILKIQHISTYIEIININKDVFMEIVFVIVWKNRNIFKGTFLLYNID